MSENWYTKVTPQPKPEKRIKLKGKEMEALRRECFKRDKYTCVQCEKPVSWASGHMAHIKSKGAGGSDILENVRTKCRECHLNLEHGQGIRD